MREEDKGRERAMVEEFEAEELTIRVDGERCIACYECMDVCPQTRGREFPVYVVGEDGIPRVANPDSCIGCLSCQVSCRAEAIRVGVTGRGRPGPRMPEDARAERKCGRMF